MPSRAAGPSVASATNLPPSAKNEQSARMRRYLFSMGLRTVCFLLAVVFTGPARWICVVLAVVLPYIAVVVANATSQRRSAVRGSVKPEEQRERLGAGPSSGSSTTW